MGYVSLKFGVSSGSMYTYGSGAGVPLLLGPVAGSRYERGKYPEVDSDDCMRH